MNNKNQLSLMPLVLTVLRVLVGWHFLYEGISKLGMSNWSSSAYLMQSKWLLAGFFHWIIGNPAALAITDLLNVWGLVLIGLALFIGIFTRMASISGIILLLMYYVANPPFLGSGSPAEANYFILT